MLTIDDMKELIKVLDESSIEEFRFEAEQSKLILKKNGNTRRIFNQSVQANGPSEQITKAEELNGSDQSMEDEVMHQIVAPMVGTLFLAPSPGSDPFIKKESRIDEKTVVCVIEAMKLFNEIEAETKGTIVDVLVEDGQLVEFGQPLFLVKKD